MQPKPKTALLVGIGKYGSIAIAISLFLSIFWIGLVILKTNDVKYTHLGNISTIIKFDPKSEKYFVNKKGYEISKYGIILKQSSSQPILSK